jgi:hypothetical protein
LTVSDSLHFLSRPPPTICSEYASVFNPFALDLGTPQGGQILEDPSKNTSYNDSVASVLAYANNNWLDKPWANDNFHHIDPAHHTYLKNNYQDQLYTPNEVLWHHTQLQGTVNTPPFSYHDQALPIEAPAHAYTGGGPFADATNQAIQEQFNGVFPADIPLAYSTSFSPSSIPTPDPSTLELPASFWPAQNSQLTYGHEEGGPGALWDSGIIHPTGIYQTEGFVHGEYPAPTFPAEIPLAQQVEVEDTVAAIVAAPIKDAAEGGEAKYAMPGPLGEPEGWPANEREYRGNARENAEKYHRSMVKCHLASNPGYIHLKFACTICETGVRRGVSPFSSFSIGIEYSHDSPGCLNRPYCQRCGKRHGLPESNVVFGPEDMEEAQRNYKWLMKELKGLRGVERSNASKQIRYPIEVGHEQ